MALNLKPGLLCSYRLNESHVITLKLREQVIVGFWECQQVNISFTGDFIESSNIISVFEKRLEVITALDLLRVRAIIDRLIVQQCELIESNEKDETQPADT